MTDKQTWIGVDGKRYATTDPEVVRRRGKARWKLAPVEPTADMTLCGVDPRLADNLPARYQAMLSAAPEPPDEVVGRVAKALLAESKSVKPLVPGDYWPSMARAALRALEGVE